jgi:hypothetical protein
MAQIFMTVDEVVANARTLLDSNVDGVTEAFLRQWAYLAQRQIGVTKENIKTEEIPVEELSIRKPDDFVLGQDMGLYTAAGSEVTYVYEKRGGRVRGPKYEYSHAIQVSEENHYYHLSSSATAIACAKLRYYALPIDPTTGDPLIPERHLFATMMFIRYMVAMRNNEREQSQYRQEWEKEAARARSKNILPDQLQFQNGTIKRYLSIIRTPQRSTF